MHYKRAWLATAAANYCGQRCAGALSRSVQRFPQFLANEELLSAKVRILRKEANLATNVVSIPILNNFMSAH